MITRKDIVNAVATYIHSLPSEQASFQIQQMANIVSNKLNEKISVSDIMNAREQLKRHNIDLVNYSADDMPLVEPSDHRTNGSKPNWTFDLGERVKQKKKERNQITEVFSKPAPVKRINDRQYQFEINGITYNIVFEKMPLPMELTGDEESKLAADVQFHSLNEKGHPQHMITNKGNAFEVFSTVLAAIYKWIQDNTEVEYIFFSGDKGEESRLKLYQRMMKMFNVEYKTREYEGDVVFMVPVNEIRNR